VDAGPRTARVTLAWAAEGLLPAGPYSRIRPVVARRNPCAKVSNSSGAVVGYNRSHDMHLTTHPSGRFKARKIASYFSAAGAGSTSNTLRNWGLARDGIDCAGGALRLLFMSMFRRAQPKPYRMSPVSVSARLLPPLPSVAQVVEKHNPPGASYAGSERLREYTLRS
jgi:hypothetical protein